MRPGVNWDSHGLKVAQLAGLPDAVIEVAADTLSWLRQKGHSCEMQQRSLATLAGYEDNANRITSPDEIAVPL